MAAPASNIQASIAASIPIIKSTLTTLKNTNPTSNKQEIDSRVEMLREMSLFSKTGKPVIGTVVPATVDPLNAAVTTAEAALTAAKTTDVDYQDSVDDVTEAREAVVTYYVGIFSA